MVKALVQFKNEPRQAEPEKLARSLEFAADCLADCPQLPRDLPFLAKGNAIPLGGQLRGQYWVSQVSVA